ncbi:MAG: nitroreductase [Sphingomicrobium sp.]
MRPLSMLNDRSSIVSLLETRRSGKPREFVGPAPSAEELDRILTLAVRVPDHGKLTPWRLVIVSDEQREVLAELLRRAMAEEDPDAGEAHHEKEDEFARSAGSLVVLISAPIENHKVPAWEQILSCGSLGMNLLIAAHALGFVAGWLTGWRAYSPTINAAFCAPGERIAGFVFIGHPGRELDDRPRPPLGDIGRPWQPPTP